MIRRLDVKIVAILLVTVLVPLGVSLFLVLKIIDTTLGLGLNEDLSRQLEQAVDTHRRYIQEVKTRFRVTTAHLLDSEMLHNAVAFGEPDDVRAALAALVNGMPNLRAVRLVSPEGEELSVERTEELFSDADARTVAVTESIAMGPYEEMIALFEVSHKMGSQYATAGKMLDIYQALVKAPPNYLKNRFVTVYLAILGVAVLLTTVGGIVLARLLVRRIHDLGSATSLVGQGDLSVRVDPGAEDEVGELVESFNAMVSELAVNRARIEYLQKISAWQEMARRLAHEIKNPLTPIQLAAQQLAEKYTGDDPAFGSLLAQSTDIIREEVETLRRLTSDFAAFAKLPAVHPEEVNLAEFLGECDSSIAAVAAQRGVAVKFKETNPDIRVMIDRIMMKRVIDNLVVNATDALLDAGVARPEVIIQSARRRSRKKLEAEIRVSDNGPGVTREHRASIFDPYYTTKSEGTGLGLAISKKIVLEHGGRIWLDEQSTSGAAFVLVLPALA